MIGKPNPRRKPLLLNQTRPVAAREGATGQSLFIQASQMIPLSQTPEPSLGNGGLMITPTVCRTVLYVPFPNSPEASNGASVVPAVIIRVWSDIAAYTDHECNLKVICDGPYDTWKTSVPYDYTGKKPGTWHYPPRV